MVVQAVTLLTSIQETPDPNLDWNIIMEVFHRHPQFLHAPAGIVHKLGHNCLLAHSTFIIINHPTI